MAPPAETANRLKAVGQEHLLTFWDDLSPTQQVEFEADIRRAKIEDMVRSFKTVMDLSGNPLKEWVFQPPEPLVWKGTAAPKASLCCMANAQEADEATRALWFKRGIMMIGQGQVAALLLAGGQGTRLGFDKPKGLYPAAPISKKPLFQLFAERIQRLEQLAREAGFKDAVLPLYVMTSHHTHEDSVDFFEQHNLFGLKRENLRFFQQEMVPCMSVDGKVILEEKHVLARNPNGNGGVFDALKDSGMYKDMKTRGVKSIHAFGVDNMLTKVADPSFIGFVDLVGAEVGNKCCVKVDPDEKIGVFAKKVPKEGGPARSCVVEYSELSADMRNARNGKDLAFNAGNICNHCFTMPFLDRLLSKNLMDEAYSYHSAHKKIPCIDLKTGQKVSPSTPNGVKMEYFIFDSFEFATSVAGFLVPRESDFSPIKNATGIDSPASAAKMMTDLHQKWVEAAGGKVEGMPEAPVEISPLVSYEGEGLEAKCKGKAMERPLHIC